MYLLKKVKISSFIVFILLIFYLGYAFCRNIIDNKKYLELDLIEKINIHNIKSVYDIKDVNLFLSIECLETDQYASIISFLKKKDKAFIFFLFENSNSLMTFKLTEKEVGTFITDLSDYLGNKILLKKINNKDTYLIEVGDNIFMFGFYEDMIMYISPSYKLIEDITSQQPDYTFDTIFPILYQEWKNPKGNVSLRIFTNSDSIVSLTNFDTYSEFIYTSSNLYKFPEQKNSSDSVNSLKNILFLYPEKIDNISDIQIDISEISFKLYNKNP